jgi:hypothetical protein
LGVKAAEKGCDIMEPASFDVIDPDREDSRRPTPPESFQEEHTDDL